MMLVSGLLFKMAVVPFHIWTPDVYEGAPVPLIAFFSVVPKLSGLVIFSRLFYALNSVPGNINWVTIFGVIAILTMFTGNLAALRQTDVKRMMGYSSIAHSGYLLVGILALNSWGLQAVIIHAVVYLFMNYLVFLMVEQYQPVLDSTKMKDYSGQFLHSPVHAILISIGFISLIGIPPTGGFTSKFLLFTSAWDAWSPGNNHILLWLVVAGVINTVISLFYYLKIPYYMAFRSSQKQNIAMQRKPVFTGLGIILAFLIFLIFIWPGGLVHIMNSLTFVIRGMTQ